MLGCFPSGDTPVRVPLRVAFPYIDRRCMDGGTGVGLGVSECGVDGLSRSADSIRLISSYSVSTDCHGIMKVGGYRPGGLEVAGKYDDRDCVIP